MQLTKIIIAAAVAASLTLVGCQKQEDAQLSAATAAAAVAATPEEAAVAAASVFEEDRRAVREDQRWVLAAKCRSTVATVLNAKFGIQRGTPVSLVLATDACPLA